MGVYGSYARRLIESKVGNSYEDSKENELNPITGLDPLRDEQGRVQNNPQQNNNRHNIEQENPPVQNDPEENEMDKLDREEEIKKNQEENK